jgi:nitrite reductase/ring-hydroxylating ferredoxin subunit
VTTDVGPVESFPDGQVSIITLGRIEVGIIRWSGKVYAVSGICTHQGGPLCRGVLSGRLAGTAPGDMTLEDAAPVIACPWHGWEFDVCTGEAIWDPAVRVRTFPVKIVADRVLVEIGAGSRRWLASPRADET